METGAITEAEIEKIQASTAKELDEAVQFATESPEPKTEDALEGVYYAAG